MNGSNPGDLHVWAAPPHWRAIDFISDLHLAPGMPQTVAAWQQVLQHGIDQGLARGWLQRVGPRLVPTTRGFDFLNDVQQLFLADPA